MKEVTLQVEGMKCGMCEAHVNDAVRRSANVKKVESSHSKGRTVVICEDDADEAAMKSAIEELGYNVGTVESKPYEKRGLFARFKKN